MNSFFISTLPVYQWPPSADHPAGDLAPAVPFDLPTFVPAQLDGQAITDVQLISTVAMQPSFVKLADGDVDDGNTPPTSGLRLFSMCADMGCSSSGGSGGSDRPTSGVVWP